MKIKRFFSLVLALSIIFGGFVQQYNSSSYAEELNILSPNFQKMEILDENDLIKIHDKNEELRVIVELRGNSLDDELRLEGKTFGTLSQSKTSSMIRSIELNQNEIINKIERVGVTLDIRERFSILMNGFSADVQYGEIASILAIPEVKDVHIANTYTIPEYIPAEVEKGNPDLTGIKRAWDLGYKGEGQLVSIIDSGIDVNHQDMVITDLSRAKIKEGFVYNEKIPFGYNWAENNSNIKDNPIYNAAHGMHVAGIIAGNGEYKGVAPEAQLIGQKVFPNNTNRYAQADALIRAVENSVVNGADVVNMSLGSRAGFVNPNDPFHKVIQKAINNGVTFTISAGNDAISTNPLPIYSDNPDTGVLGAPGTVKDAITVASYESSKINQYVLEYKSGSNFGKVSYVNSNNGTAPHIDLGDEEYQMVYCGKGEYTDFPDDLTGKIALIENVDYRFTWPAKFANEKNAKGIIFFNSPEFDILEIAVYDDELELPIVLVSSEDGFKLRGVISKRGTVSFKGEIEQVDSPNTGIVSEFSSWGPNPDLSFKPNVLAPGGNIWSTVNDNQYANMSGTSMSSPNVAGAATLISQYLIEEYPNLNGREKTVEIKNRLMSTATPVKPPSVDSIEYSPRQQGAGLIQVDKAITTKAVVTSENGLNGIELGSISNTKTFNLNVKNFGNESLSFNVETSKVITDGKGPLPEEFDTEEYSFPRNKEYNTLEPTEVIGASIDLSETQITILPGETKTITATLNIPETVDNNIFTDGFIYLNSLTEEQPNLVIPYIGFYGDWDLLNIVDPQAGSDDSYFDFTSLCTRFVDLVNMREIILLLGSYEDEDGKMRINNDLVSFAPQGRHSVNYRQLIPVVSLTRNAQDFEINILDSNKNHLRTYVKERLLRKSGWTAKAPFYVTSDSWIWDGLLYNVKGGYMEQAPEGQYYIQVRTKIEGSGSWQETILPFKLDNTGPEVTITSEKPVQGQKGYKLTWEVEDNLTDAEFFIIQSNADVLAVLDGDVREFTLDAVESGMATLQVRAYDYAYNNSSAFLNYGEPSTPGEKEPVHPHAPARLEIISRNKVNFQARYTIPRDKDGNQEGYWIKLSFKVLNEQGEVVLLREYEGNNQQNYYIQEYENINNDGKYEVIYEGIDSFGNHYADSRYIFIDTTPPELTLKNVGEDNSIVVGEDEEIFTLEGTISDNLTGMLLWINAEPVIEEYFNYIKIEPIDFSYDVKLKEGANVLQVQLGDSAGHRVYKTVTITKPMSEKELPIDISAQFINEYYSGKYSNRIKVNWIGIEEASGYNVYFNEIKVNDTIINEVNYIIDEKEGISLERDDFEDKTVSIRVEALNDEGDILSEGSAAVLIPMKPFIEWIKINGQDITDNYNIGNVDNNVEIQVKFSHRLKDNYWKRSNKPTGHIKITKQGAYKELPADFNYDEENNIYTLRPWGGLVVGKTYVLELSNSLQDIYNGSYLESKDTRYVNISTTTDDTPFLVESIKTIDGRDFTNEPIRKVPVDTKLVITFNKLIDIETYEEDDHDGIAKGIWLTKNSDGSKGYGPTRLVNTKYDVIKVGDKYKSVLTVEPRLTTGYSYKNLDQNTEYYVVIEDVLKDACGQSIGTNQIYGFKTADPYDSIEDLPQNSVIIDNEAFDIRYLDNNEEAQIKLRNWEEQGNQIYVKLNRFTIVNSRGEVVSIEVLPDILTYYDINGNTTIYTR